MPTPDVLATLAKLPSRCFVELPGSRGRRIVEIVRGVPGYSDVDTALPVERLNASLPEPPTPEQAEAMLFGSMFGWHLPGADPDVVRAHNQAMRRAR